MSFRVFSTAFMIFALSTSASFAESVTAIDVGRLFDGRQVFDTMRILVKDDKIDKIGAQSDIEIPVGAQKLSYPNSTVIPGLIASHSHVGMVSGIDHGGQFYTRDTVERDLKQFQRYGVLTVNALGLNRPLFYDLRQASRAGMMQGADLYGAGPGVGAVDGAPPAAAMRAEPDQASRPKTAEDARAAVREMKDQGIDMVKVWVDSLGGKAPKMPPEIFTAAIAEAHAQGLSAAAHIHDLEDAKAVVRAGVDVVGHGVRDADVDEEFIALMLEHDVWYVPTINIDEAEYIYAEHPEWLDSPFLRNALSPALNARIKDQAWREKAIANSTSRRSAVSYNLHNLKRLHDAGVKISFGTDSGATPLRIPGFAEHRELELMVEAGLTPTEALTVATANSAAMMGLTDRGTLAPGMRADFIILKSDPTKDIRATREIIEIWHKGVTVK